MQQLPTRYIAIIGGFAELPQQLPTSSDAAKQYAFEIGQQLARRGLGLLVYSSDENSLERHVVSGYVAAHVPITLQHHVRVRFASDQREIVNFPEEVDHPTLFDRKIFGKDWEAPFYRSLVQRDEIDGVLLIVGAKTTSIAGNICIANSTPLLAVDKFGGASAEIRSELATLSPDYPSAATHTPEQLVGWLDDQCRKQRKSETEKRRLEEDFARSTSARYGASVMLVAFLFLLATLFYGFSASLPPNLFSIVVFSGLIAAGGTGATARSSFSRARTATPEVSGLLGAVSGFLVGLAYLIPQWIGAPAVISPETTEVQATDRIQFVSAILVAFSAGVGFDTVLDRFRAEAAKHAIGPP
jgi:hypothetical protein